MEKKIKRIVYKLNGKRLSPERDLISPQLRRLLVSIGVAEDHNPTHFFTRSLFPSDVKKGLTRLTTPRNHLLAPFLTSQEEAFLQQRDYNNHLKRLQVDVVDPSLVVRVLSLSRWSYKKTDLGGTRVLQAAPMLSMADGWMLSTAMASLQGISFKFGRFARSMLLLASSSSRKTRNLQSS